MTCDSHQVNWGSLWQDKDYADLNLELTVKDDPASTQRIPVHRVYLQAKSDYFKSRLTQQYDIQDHGPRLESTAAPAAGAKKGRGKKRQKTAQPETEAERPGKPLLILTVECESSEDQIACLAALQHAYTGELLPAEDMARIVMVCKKADYLRMPATVQACLTSLSQLAAQQQPSAELTSQLLALLDSLPEQLLSNSDSGKALLQQLHTLAASKFGNTIKVMCDKQLQQEFVSLPFALLLHWASLDELVTDSENTIAVLMHMWINNKNNLQQRLCIHSTKQLSKLLRVGQLSLPFHLHALPKLPWYQPPPELPAEHALVHLGYAHCKNMHCILETATAAYGFNVRRQTADAVTIEWALSTVQIQEKWASTGLQSIQGPSRYYAGYTCTLHVHMYDEANTKHLGLFLTCKYCPELAPECSGPSHAALHVTMEAGQGGKLHASNSWSGVYYHGNWGLSNVNARLLPVEGGLQELMLYKELPIKIFVADLHDSSVG